MGKINVGRVFLGGLVAGVVALAGDSIVATAFPIARDLGILAPHVGGPSFGVSAVSAIIYAATVFLVGGPAGVWFYAAIRPRFGPGPKTAIYAALWIWLILRPYIQTLSGSLGYPNPISFRLWVAFDLISLPLVLASIIAGAAVYKEEVAASAAVGR